MEKVKLAGFQVEGRTREPEVEAQAQALLAVSRRVFWQKVRATNYQAEGRVSEEALVSVLRHWSRSSNNEDKVQAWEVAEHIVERCSGFIYQHVACWKLAPQHIDECIRDIQVQMLQDLFNDSRGTEFWEIRFWLCLKRRLLNISRHYRVLSANEVNSESILEEDGQSVDFFDKVAAVERVSPQMVVEARQALRELPYLECRAYVLYQYHDFSQEEIAVAFNVTDRTVRNWLTRASQRLKEWREHQEPPAG